MKPQAIDWFRLLWDMVQRGVPLAEVARRTGQNRVTLLAYLHGAHPAHWRGEMLVELWCAVCDEKRENVPMCDLVIMPRVRSERVRGQAKELQGVWK